MTSLPFDPKPALLPGAVRPSCRACVILPARNEEEALPSALDALANQTDDAHRPLQAGTFEILLLLNNCTDSSYAVAKRWKEEHPLIDLHVLEKTLCKEEAHVGTARRLLMDTAWHRLQTSQDRVTGILSTDSDTEVASDWVWRNLLALEIGADAVGGVIHLKEGDLLCLPANVQKAFLHDRAYQELVAELEDLLDPQLGDSWPRHVQHFGASLACKPQAYACAGGMPSVTPLEDIAFVDALRRCEARLRHDPAVMVYTSSRMEGRAPVGLSGQLRNWKTMGEKRVMHKVPSAEWLVHRFTSLRALRLFSVEGRTTTFGEKWFKRLKDARLRAGSTADFLMRIDCDKLIEETFSGRHEGPIDQVSQQLTNILEAMRER